MQNNGLWRSLVAHLTGGQGVAGSNPVSPTSKPRRTAKRRGSPGLSSYRLGCGTDVGNGQALRGCAAGRGRGLPRADVRRRRSPHPVRSPSEPGCGEQPVAMDCQLFLQPQLRDLTLRRAGDCPGESLAKVSETRRAHPCVPVVCRHPRLVEVRVTGFIAGDLRCAEVAMVVIPTGSIRRPSPEAPRATGEIRLLPHQPPVFIHRLRLARRAHQWSAG